MVNVIADKAMAQALSFDVNRPEFGFCPPDVAKAIIAAALDLIGRSGLPSNDPAVMSIVTAVNKLDESFKSEPPRHLIKALVSNLSDGDLELDSGFGISDGGDNGVYIQTWKWVDFGDSVLDRSADDDVGRGVSPENIEIAEAFYGHFLSICVEQGFSKSIKSATLEQAMKYALAVENEDHRDHQAVKDIIGDWAAEISCIVDCYASSFGASTRIVELIPNAENLPRQAPQAPDPLKPASPGV